MSAFLECVQGKQRRWVSGCQPEGMEELYYRLHDKMICRYVVSSLGGTIPSLLGTALSFREALRIVEKSGSGVVKPQRNHSGRGVLCLAAEGNAYRNVLDAMFGTTKPLYGEEGWESDLERAREEWRIKGPWLVEERVVGRTDEVPDEYKFYCFGGQPLAVNYRRPSAGRDGTPVGRFSLYNMDWKRRPLRYSPDKLLPEDVEPDREIRDRMAERASAIASRLLLPFIRVDLYDGADGIVSGELTVAPGLALHLTPEDEQIWVDAWHKAAQDMRLEILNGKANLRLCQHIGMARRLGIPVSARGKSWT